MRINMDNWAADIIAADDVRALPILFFPVVPETGKGVIEAVKDSDAHFEVMKKVIDRFPEMITSMTGMDLTTEAETFGCEVKFKDTEAPSTEGEIAKNREAIEALEVPSVEAGRASVFYNAANKAANYFTDRPVFGGVLGPYSVAAVLAGLQRSFKIMMKDPDTMHLLMQKCTEYVIAYAKAFKDAGANGILLAEPTAGLLSPDQCHEFSSKYVKQLVDAVQDEEFFVVLHNCGPIHLMVDSLVSTGSKGYSFGNVVDMAEMTSKVPGDYLVFGNIDPARMLTESPETIEKETRELLEKMKPYPNFVLASGCDLPLATPLENIDAFFKALADFNEENLG